MNIKNVIGFVLSVFLLSACAGTTTDYGVPTGVIPGSPTGGSTNPVGAKTPSKSSTPQVSGSTDRTPAQIAALQALSDRYNIPTENITIISTEAVTWPDGCLGVETPGVMCTQALVEGYRIILEANGQQYEYHTDQEGTNVVEATNILH